MLILRYLQLLSRFPWSLSNLIAVLRMILLTHKDLWAWLEKPFLVVDETNEPEQMKLNLIGQLGQHLYLKSDFLNYNILSNIRLTNNPGGSFFR
jgi:hypothetical protein